MGRTPWRPRTLGVVLTLVLAATAAMTAPVSAAPPSNDYFANATDATVTDPFYDTLNTSEATVQVNEPTPSCASSIGKSVWYRFTASSDGDIYAETYNANFNAVLGGYVGTSLSGLGELGCSRSTSNNAIAIDIAMYAGETYYFQVSGDQGAGGTVSVYIDPTIAVDTTPPTVTKPLPSVHVGSKLGSGSSRISWSGYDQSGISYYELQKSSNGGSWQNVGLPYNTATSVAISLSLNVSVQFRVRATDNASNTSGWKLGPSFTPVLYEDRSPAVTYSGLWTRSTDPNSSGGTHTWTRTAGARVSLNFTGRTVAFIAPTDYHRGRADVIVDGVLMATVDLYSGSARERVVLFSHDWSSVGNHTIVIRNKGTAGRPKIDLDTFLVYQ